jgi:hypothetical protein
MPRLIINPFGEEPQSYNLKLGTTRIGRHPANDVQIDHTTVSCTHCELIWMNESVLVRDCDSTNGTFINEVAIQEGVLCEGQRLRIGDIEARVEGIETIISIPSLPVHEPARSVVLADGTRSCLNHRARRAAFHCSKCHELFCSACIRVVRRVGGACLRFCPECGGPCDLLPGVAPRKENWFKRLLSKTLRLRRVPREEIAKE